MRQLKQRSVEAYTKVYAAQCAEAGLYKRLPAKPEWKLIVAKVTTDCGMLRIPYAYAKVGGDMQGVWVRAYDAALRAVKAGKHTAKPAPKPKARTRKPKAQPKAAESVTITVTPEQRDLLVALLSQSA